MKFILVILIVAAMFVVDIAAVREAYHINKPMVDGIFCLGFSMLFVYVILIANRYRK